MRPAKTTAAHVTDYLAELVCSNSFKSLNPDSPAGQLKLEMEALGSLMIPTAKKHAVPGGEALTVDRNQFAAEMTEHIQRHANIEVVREEWDGTLEGDQPLVIATGPLTSTTLSEKLREFTGSEHLHFFDAVAPTVDAASIDRSIVWEQSRYDKGEAAYLNCPFDKEQYEAFIDALTTAEQSTPHEFEKGKYFEGCMPIEEIAARGRDSLRFGNMKPVGLTNPHTGTRAYAVLQLRPENREKTLYSMVACQSRMKWGAQKRVLSMIPGLENAEFVRFGVIHQNLYLDSPRLIDRDFMSKKRTGLFFAGQITGVEGYVESGAVGILTGINAARIAKGEPTTSPPRQCAYGSLSAHVTNDHTEEFSPMNINWGLFPEPEPPIKDKGARRQAKLQAARESFADWQASLVGIVSAHARRLPSLPRCPR
jgi:methylenetetrahydrofolate--tRNA-(uracil-5-)-methyltransferase